MGLIDLILWLLLLGILLGALLLLLFTWWEEGRTQRLLRRYEGLCDGADGVGLSLLLSEPRSGREVEESLLLERSRYEVVVVLNSERDLRLVEELREAFDLIRVDYHPLPELPVYGVEALYRSRQRGLRRLVLLTRSGGGGVEEDWTAAAGVASYEWLLPLRGGVHLRRRGVERLLAEVESRPSGSVQGVVTLDRVRLLSWEAVVWAGGFGSYLERSLKWERLFLFVRTSFVESGSKSVLNDDFNRAEKNRGKKIFWFRK